LAEAPPTLHKGGAVRLHHGTTDGAARVRVLGSSGEGELFVELRLADPAVLAPGDRFILRRPAPVDTVGGGVIVDADPPLARQFAPSVFELGALAPEAAVRNRLARAGAAGRTPAELATALALPPRAIAAALAGVEREASVVSAASRWFDARSWHELSSRVLAAVAEFHAAHPLEAGVSREALRGRLCPAMPLEAWRELLERLGAEGRLRLSGESVAAGGHAVVLTGAELALAQRIEERYREAGLSPPELDGLLDKHERALARPIVEQLVAGGRLARIQGGRLFHSEALARLRVALREYARTSRTIDVAAFKKLAGVSRKNAIPLLEQLDAERTTRRVGDQREILAAPRE
jgi:selenocysteine-specific elongation factor